MATPDVYDVRITVEKSDEMTRRIAEKFRQLELQALIAYEYGTKNGVGHYQGLVIGTAKDKKIRDWCRQTLDLNRTKYKVSALKKSLDDLIRYTCKGNGDYAKFKRGDFPDIVINTEGWDVVRYYNWFWELNTKYREESTEGMTLRQQIKRKCDEMSVNYQLVNAKLQISECAAYVLRENAKKGRSISTYHYAGAIRSIYAAESETAVAEYMSLLHDYACR